MIDRRHALRWAPAIVLVFGAVLTLGVDLQRTVPLRSGLSESIPMVLNDLHGTDLVLPENERVTVAVSDYLLRSYRDPSGETRLSLYVGYYDRQTGDKTIHSPKNCLPGAGWEALASRSVLVSTAAGTMEVNQYLIQRGASRALVYYWYQGRGRVESNEYRVKWDLLRDAALRGRTEEALVRVVVPVTGGEEESVELGRRVANLLIPKLFEVLPS